MENVELNMEIAVIYTINGSIRKRLHCLMWLPRRRKVGRSRLGPSGSATVSVQSRDSLCVVAHSPQSIQDDDAAVVRYSAKSGYRGKLSP